MKHISLLLHFRIICLVVLAVCLACKEPLPAYRNPNDVFVGSINAEYLYSSRDNSLSVQIVMRNTFDETFEARGVLEGTVEITLQRLPEYKKTFSLSAANLIQARGYNPSSKVLTFDAGDSIRLGVVWSFTDDNGKDLRRDVFQYGRDRTCGSRRIAASESFVVRANLKVYDRTEAVKAGPIVFGMCHVDVWIDPRQCPLLLASEACRYAY